MDTVEKTAEKFLWPLRNPKGGTRLAERGRGLARRRFPLTPLVAAKLGLYALLLAGAPHAEPRHRGSTESGHRA